MGVVEAVTVVEGSLAYCGVALLFTAAQYKWVIRLHTHTLTH